MKEFSEYTTTPMVKEIMMAGSEAYHTAHATDFEAKVVRGYRLPQVTKARNMARYVRDYNSTKVAWTMGAPTLLNPSVHIKLLSYATEATRAPAAASAAPVVPKA
jgi:hypothetical protein